MRLVQPVPKQYFQQPNQVYWKLTKNPARMTPKLMITSFEVKIKLAFIWTSSLLFDFCNKSSHSILNKILVYFAADLTPQIPVKTYIAPVVFRGHSDKFTNRFFAFAECLPATSILISTKQQTTENLI